MQRAMDETERRRNLQEVHNEKHGITPMSIKKDVADIMEGAHAAVGHKKRARKVAEDSAAYAANAEQSFENMAKEIKRLEDKMYQHARNLEFEEAANTRDMLGKLREKSLAS
jgi:excinuclease ABC subunit B